MLLPLILTGKFIYIYWKTGLRFVNPLKPYFLNTVQAKELHFIHNAFQFFIPHCTRRFANFRVMCVIILRRNRTCPCSLVCQYILCLLRHCLHVSTVLKVWSASVSWACSWHLYSKSAHTAWYVSVPHALSQSSYDYPRSLSERLETQTVWAVY
jgi:hypothetical protein